MQSREHFIEVHESSRLHVQFHAQQQPAIPHALFTINQQQLCYLSYTKLTKLNEMQQQNDPGLTLFFAVFRPKE